MIAQINWTYFFVSGSSCQALVTNLQARAETEQYLVLGFIEARNKAANQHTCNQLFFNNPCIQLWQKMDRTTASQDPNWNQLSILHSNEKKSQRFCSGEITDVS